MTTFHPQLTSQVDPPLNQVQGPHLCACDNFQSQDLVKGAAEHPMNIWGAVSIINVSLPPHTTLITLISRY